MTTPLKSSTYALTQIHVGQGVLGHIIKIAKPLEYAMEIEGKIVGRICVRIPKSGVVYIDYMENTGKIKGLGSFLVECLFRFLKPKQISLDANQNSHFFYMKLGFKPKKGGEKIEKIFAAHEGNETVLRNKASELGTVAMTLPTSEIKKWQTLTDKSNLLIFVPSFFRRLVWQYVEEVYVAST